MADKIKVTIKGDTVQTRPVDYLGDSFQTYLAATRAVGMRFNRSEKCQEADREILTSLVRSLLEMGFEPVGNSELQEALREIEAEEEESLQDAEARITAPGAALFPYQKEGVKFLLEQEEGAALFDDAGLGKTIQALVAYPKNARVLLTCPAAVKYQWRNEAKVWRADLTPVVLEGEGSFRWPKEGEIVITNPHIYPDLDDPILENPPSNVILTFDEVQMFKNWKSQRTKKASKMSEAVRNRGGKAWGLTATPLMKEPFDLWNVLGALGLNWKTFTDWDTFLDLFNGSRSRWGGYNFGLADPEVKTRLSLVSLRRKREDVLDDLPPIRFRDLPVDVDGRVEYQTAFSIVEELSDRDNVKSVPFEEISKARALLAKDKTPVALEIVEEYEESETPLVVFSAHRFPVDTIGERDGWATITGDVPGEERTQIANDFAAGKYKGVAATIRSAGTGLDGLQHGANHVLFVDQEWTPALNEQAVARVSRYGQKKGVLVTRLIADNNLDWRLLQLLEWRQKLIDETVEQVSFERQTNLAERVGQLPEREKATKSQGSGNGNKSRRESKATDARYQGPEPTSHGLRFTVVREDGSHRTLRLREKIRGNLAGKTFVEYLSGPDNSRDYTAFGFLKDDGTLQLWRRFKDRDDLVEDFKTLATLDVEGLEDAGERYAIESSRCWRCGKTLTVPASIHRGLGPVCAKKM